MAMGKTQVCRGEQRMGTGNRSSARFHRSKEDNWLSAHRSADSQNPNVSEPERICMSESGEHAKYDLPPIETMTLDLDAC